MAKSVWRQKVVAQCIVLIVCMGMNFGVNFTSITPFNNMIWSYWGYKGFYTDSDLMQGIISASLIIGAMAGSLSMSFIIDRFGRKHPIGFLSCFSVLFCCLSALAQLDPLNIWWLCITRALFGVPVGFLTGAGPIYVSEICPPEIRGRLNTMVQMFITVGILVAYGIGAIVEGLSCNKCEVVQDGGCYYDSGCYGNSWINLFLGFIWTVPLVIAVWRFPESYATKSAKMIAEGHKPEDTYDKSSTEVVTEGKHKDNAISTSESSQLVEPDEKKKGMNRDAEAEISSELALNETNDTNEVGGESRQTQGNTSVEKENKEAEEEREVIPATWKEVFRDYRNCACFGIIASMCQQLSGINAVIIYAPRIFALGIDDEALAKTLGGVGVSAWNCITTFVGLALIDKVGRKILMFSGFVVMGVGMFLMWIGNAFIMNSNSSAAFIVMIVGLCFYIFAFEFGPGPIFYVLIGEMFPAEIKSKCGPVMNTAMWISNLLVVFLFPILEKAMNGWVWFIFFIFNVIGLLVTWFLAVETKGVELSKIHSMMYKPKVPKASKAPEAQRTEEA